MQGTVRVSDALLHLPHSKIRIVCVYGYHSSIPNSLGLNDALFSEVIQQAASYRLPTIVAGDFNMLFQDSHLAGSFLRQGFVDLGLKFACLRGGPPDPTYRGRSRLDYAFCNAAADHMVQSFGIDPRGYTDHASLHIQLVCHMPRTGRMVWSMPVDLASQPEVLAKIQEYNVPQEKQSEFCKHIASHCLDDAFRTFAESFGHVVAKAHDSLGLGNLPVKFLGRARGRLLPQRSAGYSLSNNGHVLSDQKSFRLRQQLVRNFGSWYGPWSNKCHAIMLCVCSVGVLLSMPGGFRMVFLNGSWRMILQIMSRRCLLCNGSNQCFRQCFMRKSSGFRW